MRFFCQCFNLWLCIQFFIGITSINATLEDELINSLFAEEGAYDGLEEVQRRLMQLDAIYAERNDPEAARKRSLIGPLIEASKTNQEKCRGDYLTEIHSWVSDSQEYGANLCPYLKQCLKNLIIYCRETYEDTLKEVISEKMMPEEIADLLYLVDGQKRLDPCENINDLVKHKSETEQKLLSADEGFSYVLGVCSKYLSSVGDRIELGQAMLYSPDGSNPQPTYSEQTNLYHEVFQMCGEYKAGIEFSKAYGFSCNPSDEAGTSSDVQETPSEDKPSDDNSK